MKNQYKKTKGLEEQVPFLEVFPTCIYGTGEKEMLKVVKGMHPMEPLILF